MSKLSQLQSITLQAPLPESFLPIAYLVCGEFPTEEHATPTVVANDEVRAAVRSLLRFGGYKPSGRGRPASESLAKAVEDGRWPTIFPLVDECNRQSLKAWLPISVLDAELLKGALTLRLGEPGESYVFNPSGQVLDLKGLLLLADEGGPTGSPVKDAQRSKVSAGTQEHLIVVWGTTAAASAVAGVGQGLEEWCRIHNASCRRLNVTPAQG